MRHRVPTEVAEKVMRDAGLEPLEPYPGSEARWRCRCTACGAEVQPRYGSVRRGQGGCGACGGARGGAVRRVSAEAAEQVMREAGLEPLEPYPGSGKPWRCRCLKCEREVSPRYDRVKRGAGGCGYCARRAVDADSALLVMRTAGLEPHGPYPGARTPWPSTCLSCGREVAPRFDYIHRRGRGGCRSCSQRARDAVSRTRINPDTAVEVMLASSLRPLDPFPGRVAPWRCECLRCGREVAVQYGRVKQEKPTGCAYCNRKRVDPEVAAEAMRAAGLEPLTAYPGNRAPWPCRCQTCGREVSPRFNSIDQGQGGCTHCSRRAVAGTTAMEGMREAGLEPLEPYPGSNKAPWRCRCLRCEREVSPRYNSIQQGRGGCPYCAGTATDEDEAVSTMRAAGVEPLTPYPGGHTPWRCHCLTCGREVTPTYRNIAAGNGGCKHCTDSGFWMAHESAATVYLLVNETLGALKIGIMRDHSNRIDHHQRNGWRLVDAWRDLDLATAHTAEQAVLAAWRNSGIPDAVTREDMPQGGWSETAPLDLVDLARTRAVVEDTIRMNVDPG